MLNEGMKFSLYEFKCYFHFICGYLLSLCLKERLCSLFSGRLMTVTGEFRLPIGRLRQSTNRQS